MKKVVIVFSIFCLFLGCVSAHKENTKNASNTLQSEQVKTPEEQYSLGKINFEGAKYDEALHWFITAAEQGHSGAQAYLGEIYGSDKYGLNDINKSAYWYNKAAENGSAVAQFNIAGLYRIGARGFSKDLQKSAYWYLKAAEQGDVHASYYIAEMYWFGEGVSQDWYKSFRWHKKSAEQQHDHQKWSQFRLGVAFNQGLGVSKSVEAAIYWFQKAAKKGNVRAQVSLGMIFFDPSGDFCDYKKAAEWYKKAADQGLPEAQFMMGLMYEHGQGALRDSQKAIEWYEKAAKQGHTQAQKNIDRINKQQRDDYYLYTKAAEKGYADAQYYLGQMYYNGQGVPQDYKQAVHWFTKAAEKGYADAQYYLGVMYDNGPGVPQDYKKAANWYTKAAEQGHVDAQYNLGVMYYKGEGVAQNYKLTYVWESLAAAQGDEGAIKNRDIIAKKLTPQQLSEAQDLATKIQYQIDNAAGSSTSPPAKPGTGEIIGTGTGFLITRDGYLLTCLHVVQDAARIEIHAGDNMYPASLIRSDPNNDLAILKINGSFPALAFSPHRSAKMGQDVFTVGYPNPGLQGISAKYTKGTVSGLTGFQDDLRLYQISIPIQPGNSGGALLDEYGNLLGVVVAMLNAKTTFQISGSLPQNVNYAVKGLYAQAMIDTIPEMAGKLLSPLKSKSGAIDNAQNSTVMVVCYD
jgi:uncharacterized protein